MDLQTRKLHFIQQFLRLANKSMVDKFEKMLSLERKKMFENEVKPMTMKQYEQKINKALEDHKENRLTHVRNLKKDINTWK